MLEIQDLHVSYGQIKAIKGISLSVPDKCIVTLIGANGAGKTTLLRTISGLIKSKSGSIKISMWGRVRGATSPAGVRSAHTRKFAPVMISHR